MPRVTRFPPESDLRGPGWARFGLDQPRITRNSTRPLQGRRWRVPPPRPQRASTRATCGLPFCRILSVFHPYWASLATSGRSLLRTASETRNWPYFGPDRPNCDPEDITPPCMGLRFSPGRVLYPRTPRRKRAPGSLKKKVCVCSVCVHCVCALCRRYCTLVCPNWGATPLCTFGCSVCTQTTDVCSCAPPFPRTPHLFGPGVRSSADKTAPRA